MSMTLEKAKRNFLEATLNAGCVVCVDVDAVAEMLRAEEELQQYRTLIGLTPEDLKALEKDEIQTIGDALKAFAAWSQLKEIGTLEELQALKEKATAKSMKMVNGVYSCCSCGLAFAVVNQGYCINCGQNLIEQREGRE